MITLPLPWAVITVLLTCFLAVRTARRLPSECDGLDFRVVARHVPLLLFVPPLCALALIGDMVLTWSPHLQWRLPQPALVYYAPLSRGLALTVLAFVGTLVSALALRGRHAQAPLVLVLAAAFLGAFLFAQYSNARALDVGALRNQEKDGVVLQSSSTTCVAAACANIARKFGLKTSEIDMVRALGTSTRGTSTAQIVYGMSRLGFSSRLVEARSIDEVAAPALLLVNSDDSHAVAYMGKENGHLVVLDPMRGRALLTPDLLGRQWNGHAIELRPY